MKILFKQQSQREAKEGPLFCLGIRQCYLKRLTPATDRRFITNKSHHHTGFEIHLIEEGEQSYVFEEEERLTVPAGHFLLIPPSVRHRNEGGDPLTVKNSLTFALAPQGKLAEALPDQSAPLCAPMGEEVRRSLASVRQEAKTARPFGSDIIETRLSECILLLLREWAPNLAPAKEKEEGDPRFPAALQFIRDNACRPLTVAEVASYVCVSPKQLSRIFREEAGACVAEIIRRERCLCIEERIAEGKLSFSGISEEMGFSSEYHFHSFFRRYAGMTPGAYRKSIKK